MASVQAEVRELVDAIRSEGFQCAIERDGHWHIYRHGRPVLKTHGGPVTLPSSPSDARWRDNTITMLRDARVLAHDPRKRDQMRLAQRDPELRQMREDMRQRFQPPKPEKLKGRQEADERTIAVRERTVAAIEQLGVSRAEFVRLCMKVGAAKGMQVWKTSNSGEVGIGDLINKNVKSTSWVLDLVEAALDDIGAAKVATEPPVVVASAAPAESEATVATTKRGRKASTPDPRLADLRPRIKARVDATSAAQFSRDVVAAGAHLPGRKFANSKAADMSVRRVLRGHGADKWAVDQLEAGVNAESRPTEADVLAGMRDLAQVPAPEPTPQPAPPAPPAPEPAPVPEPVATNGTIRHVTIEELEELVLLSRVHGLLLTQEENPSVTLADELGKLVNEKVEHLAAA